MIIKTSSPEMTIKAGKLIAKFLNKSDIVLISGSLGAGKTTLIKGICEYYKIDKRDVVSPSFTLINEYYGEVSIAHIDLYRIEGIKEIEDIVIQIQDYIKDFIILIEWGEKIENYFKEFKKVFIEKKGDKKRVIRIEDEWGKI